VSPGTVGNVLDRPDVGVGTRQRRPTAIAELLIDDARGEDHLHEQKLLEPVLVVRESSMVRRPLGVRREGTA
jgi:LacI family transcriptional regulator, galactose operon repressor